MKRIWLILLAVATTACAGFQKDCAHMSASNFGSNWIVVQYRQDGSPFHCWKLLNSVVESHEGGTPFPSGGLGRVLTAYALGKF